MNRFKNIIFVLGVIFGAAVLVTGCSSAEDKPKDSQLTTLALEADSLQESIVLGDLLKASSLQDKADISGLLYSIKVDLLYLAENPGDEKIYQKLRINLKKLEQLQILSRDRTQIEGFTQKVYQAVGQVAVTHGLDLEGYGWSQFSYKFSSGPAPFSTFPFGAWEAAWAMDESYIRAKGYGVHAWLLSPTFDLTQVRNPGFQMKHTILLDRNNKVADAFDRPRILKEAFQVVVSTDYVPGDDPAKATWSAPLDLGALPNSYDFHYVDTPVIDLKQYEGKKITIAAHLYLDSSALGRHYPTWQIKNFQLIGSGQLGELIRAPEAIPSLLKIELRKDSMEPLKNFTAELNGANWIPTTAGGKNYAKAGSRPQIASDAWLLSPIIKIGEQKNPFVTVAETVRNPIQSNHIVKISRDYKGGDPRLATWEIVDREEIQVPADKWFDTTFDVDLSDYKNEEIVIAFQFVDNGAPGDRIWEILSLDFKGEGALLETERITVGVAP